jgi:hypothetical protein
MIAPSKERSMLQRLPLALLLLAAICLGGCTNECHQLCDEIADYWDECQKSYESSEISDCKKAFNKNKKVEDGEDDEVNLYNRYLSSCRQLTRKVENDDGDMVSGLRAQFTCEEMQNGPGSAFGG